MTMTPFLNGTANTYARGLRIRDLARRSAPLVMTGSGRGFKTSFVRL